MPYRTPYPIHVLPAPSVFTNLIGRYYVAKQDTSAPAHLGPSVEYLDEDGLWSRKAFYFPSKEAAERALAASGQGNTLLDANLKAEAIGSREEKRAFRR